MAVLDGGRGRVEWMGSTVLPEPSSEITLIIMPYDPRVFILSIDLMHSWPALASQVLL